MRRSETFSNEKTQKFALRKSSIGTVSVSLGICIMSQNNKVLANNSTNNALNTMSVINSENSSVNNTTMPTSCK